MKHKIYASLDSAVADIPDGARIMFGGFGGAGFPNNLIQALARRGTQKYHRHQQQLRNGRRRAGIDVQEQPDPARDRCFPRSARQLFSGALGREGSNPGTRAARNSLRTHARCCRRILRVLHHRRRRHRSRCRKGRARHRREALHPRDAAFTRIMRSSRRREPMNWGI